MSKVLINDTYLKNIANAIINKGGSSTGLTPAQMSRAIAAIPSGTDSSGYAVKTGSFTPISDITAVDIPITLMPYLIVVWTAPTNTVAYTGFRMMLIIKDQIQMNAFDSVTSSATPLFYSHDSTIVGYNDGHVDREAYAVYNNDTIRVVSGNSYYLSKFKAGQEHKYLIVGTIV